MHVTIERETLLRILLRTQGVVDKRHAMAVLTNALIEADNSILSIIASDLEVSLKQSIPATVKQSGRAATSARTLFEIVRESSDDTITLKTLDNQWLAVSYGKSNFKLMGIDPDEYPGMPEVSGNGSKATTIELEADDMSEMIRKTVFSVSSDDTRSNLAGVYLCSGDKKGTIRMVATDGHRLALVERPASGKLTDGAILPRKGLAEIGKILPEESGKVRVTLSSSEAMIEIGESLLSMRLVEGNFPDYRKVIPEETPRVIGLDRDALLATLRRISILSTERARGVRFALSDGAIEISANNPDMGEASEELAAEYNGDSIQIGFNAKYLLDVLAVLPEGSHVELCLGDELSPGVVRSGDSGYTYVVMPLRI